jgi:hypothetical protein
MVTVTLMSVTKLLVDFALGFYENMWKLTLKRDRRVQERRFKVLKVDNAFDAT